MHIAVDFPTELRISYQELPVMFTQSYLRVEVYDFR